MKKFLLLLFAFLLSTESKSQDNEIWFVKCDSLDLNNCGYFDSNGNMKIPYGKYFICFTDTFRTFAIVLKSGEGFIGIDKQENKLFEIYPFDNGPDYISDGTFRIIENNKMGIADTSGKILIKPIYDFTYGFENGIAIVNIGGHSERSDPTDPNCEYYTWAGGYWGIIDRQGNILLELKYNYFWNSSANKFEFINENEAYEIVEGRIIRTK
ncbi:MAG: hypothetical protein A2W99_07010 [Bacteroidetes bacterium GWF2_33_16]|nr:MAG: hypothetical protein A2X00_12330 [Bacteroidetes bacterium GWE2_32_14]OFY08318.1 MAG: hypothetical protein A2W99_07010 [Bacteroidetes bacterium GWF2_33_16]